MTCEPSARIKHGQRGWSTAGRRCRGQRNRCVLEVALLSMIRVNITWQEIEEETDKYRKHTPLIPGRSMLACSWIPMPLRMIRREPSLNAPEHVTSWEWQKKKKCLLRRIIFVYLGFWVTNILFLIITFVPLNMFVPCVHNLLRQIVDRCGLKLLIYTHSLAQV